MHDDDEPPNGAPLADDEDAPFFRDEEPPDWLADADARGAPDDEGPAALGSLLPAAALSPPAAPPDLPRARDAFARDKAATSAGGGAQRSGRIPLAAPRQSAPEPAIPCDLTAERAILSACMLSAESASLAIGQVRATDFYDPRHRVVFEAVSKLSMLGRASDVVSILGELEMAGHGEAVGLPYLSELLGLVGSTLSVEHYARRVARLASVKRVLEAAHKITVGGYQRGVDPDEFLPLAEKTFDDALQDAIRGEAVPIKDVVGEVYRGILEARERGGDVVGISTGFRDLDKMTLGMHGTDLFILAARPAMGKTAFALNLALQVALQRRRKPKHDHDRNSVLVFSFEMGREQLVQRLLAARASIGLTQLRKGELSTDDLVQLQQAAAELSELNFFIDDTPALSPTDVRARARRVAQKQGLELVVVDYLQLMKGSGGAKQSREQEISEISRSLKGLAKELGVSVLALSQLNRGVEGRPNKRPMMSDLRESGAIEQDADLIAFIYRDVVYNKDAPEHLAELIIAKQRAGMTGTVNLHFDGRLTRFHTLDARMSDEYAGV